MIRSKFLFAGLGLSTLPMLPVEAQQKPNVVFILADDLGYGDLSCFGQEKFLTPHIDRLALSGCVARIPMPDRRECTAPV